MAIKLRRGNWVDFDPNKLVESELALVLDRGELYFCYAPGQVKRLQTREDLEELLNTSPETLNALEEIISELADAPEEVLEILAHFMDIEEIIEAAEEATQRANNISDDLQYKLDTNYFKGEKGDPGDRGVNWRGTYSSDETYYQYDGVNFNGSSYILKVEQSQGNAPTDSTKWDILANKGADGLGTGDMLKSVYDPQGKEQDIFEYADTKIPLTDIVQTAEVNDANKVPSSAVTHNLAQSLNELNNKLAVQTVDLSTILTVENPKHTIQYAKAMKYGNIVTLMVHLATSDKFSNAEVPTFTLPNGYRPLIPVRVPCMLHNNPVGIPAFGYTDIGYCTVEPDGFFVIRNYTGSTANYAIVSVTYIAN